MSFSSKATLNQAKYYKICEENVAMNKKFNRESNPRIKYKLRQTLIKGRKTQIIAEREYRLAIQKQCYFYPQFIKKCPSIMDNMQHVEQKTKLLIKTSIEKFNLAFEKLDHYISNFTTSIKSALDLVDIVDDTNQWIDINQTGNERTPLPKFIPFDFEQSEPLPNIKSTFNGFLPPKIEYNSLVTEKYEEDCTEEYTEEYGEKYNDEYAEEYNEEYGEEYTEEYDVSKLPYVFAQWDYTALEQNELSFKLGDKIYLLGKEEENWCIGQTENGNVGLFPINFTIPPD